MSYIIILTMVNQLFIKNLQNIPYLSVVMLFVSFSINSCETVFAQPVQNNVQGRTFINNEKSGEKAGDIDRLIEELRQLRKVLLLQFQADILQDKINRQQTIIDRISDELTQLTAYLQDLLNGQNEEDERLVELTHKISQGLITAQEYEEYRQTMLKQREFATQNAENKRNSVAMLEDRLQSEKKQLADLFGKYKELIRTLGLAVP